MQIPDPLRSRWFAMLVLAAVGAAPLAAAPAAPAKRPPLECDDAVVLRTVAAGLHFRGPIPEGLRLTDQGLRNARTGEELRITVETGPSGAAVVRVDDARVEVHDIRTTGETEDGWRCAASFVLHEDGRTLRGDADYSVTTSGLEFRIGGTFTMEGVELRF